MLKKKKLTPVEWEIMEAVWELGGSPSVRDVIEHAYPNGEKAYTTIQTVMNTLERKGWLGREKIGLVNFYLPMRSRDEQVKVEMSALVSRIFDGDISALASSLLSLEGVTLDEVQEIKELLGRKERELRGGES
jgi:BlaI family penicillinase repressor